MLALLITSVDFYFYIWNIKKNTNSKSIIFRPDIRERNCICIRWGYVRCITLDETQVCKEIPILSNLLCCNSTPQKLLKVFHSFWWSRLYSIASYYYRYTVLKWFYLVHTSNGLGHGLRTTNEGINQRNLKIWADVTDNISFGRTWIFGGGSGFLAVQWRRFPHWASVDCA